jgi:hypothetical protein
MGTPLRVTFEAGPRHGQIEVFDYEPAVVIGDGSAKGVYQRTGEIRDDMTVFRWQSLSDAEVETLLRGDFRANQP